MDALIEQGLADPERLGIMGHSYGALAAALALHRTHRFKAASLSDGVYNLLSYYGQAYLTNEGWLDYYLGGDPTSGPGRYLSQSPISYATDITTPTLIRVGEARFPRPHAMPVQGMELLRALHQAGTPVEFLYHPTQGHLILDREVYRDWVARNIRWFDHWVLGMGPDPRLSGPPASAAPERKQ